MLILANIGKAELELTTSATNENFMQAKYGLKEFILDYLQNPSERVNNMVQRMVLIYGTLSPDFYGS